MKTLIDNTSLHRLLEILNKGTSNKFIRYNDFIILLHFAEQIMFSEGLEVSAFAENRIWNTSYRAIEILRSIGCLLGEQNQNLLLPIEYSDTEYTNACKKASNLIIEDLYDIDKKSLKKIGDLADISTRNIGLKSTAVRKWIETKWSNKERSNHLENIVLSDKSYLHTADGPIDYAVCTNDVLYEQLRLLSSLISRKNTLKISFGIDVLFRTAINQSLAGLRNTHYCPSPQRAKIIFNSDIIFRHAVEKMIIKISKKSEYNISSKFIKDCRKQEVLPLPILAIHFLRREKIRNPFELLESARKIRDRNEVKKLRKWMKKWEALYGSKDPDKRKKSFSYVKELSRNLATDMQMNVSSLFSIFRGEISLEPSGSITIRADAAETLAPLIRLLGKFSRRRIFLAAVASEYLYDQHLGRDIIEWLDLPIKK